MKWFVKMHREFWGSMPQWLKTIWKVGVTISLGAQVSPLIYVWTH